MVNENYNTVVKLDVEDAIINYLKTNKTFKMFCSSLDGIEDIRDISFSFKYTPKSPEDNFEVEKDKMGWTRKPIPIPSKTKRKKIKYDDNTDIIAYHEDYGD